MYACSLLSSCAFGVLPQGIMKVPGARRYVLVDEFPRILSCKSIYLQTNAVAWFNNGFQAVFGQTGINLFAIGKRIIVLVVIKREVSDALLLCGDADGVHPIPPMLGAALSLYREMQINEIPSIPKTDYLKRIRARIALLGGILQNNDSFQTVNAYRGTVIPGKSISTGSPILGMWMIAPKR